MNQSGSYHPSMYSDGGATGPYGYEYDWNPLTAPPRGSHSSVPSLPPPGRYPYNYGNSHPYMNDNQSYMSGAYPPYPPPPHQPAPVPAPNHPPPVQPTPTPNVITTKSNVVESESEPVSHKRKAETDPVDVLDVPEGTISSNNTENRKRKNRVNAKKSRARKKTYNENLEHVARQLKDENTMFREFVRNQLGCDPEAVLKKDASLVSSQVLSKISKDGIEGLLKQKYEPAKIPESSGGATSEVGSSNSGSSNSGNAFAPGLSHSSTFLNSLYHGVDGMGFLSPMDVVFLQALQDSGQSYLLTNPCMADDPIVFCSEAFCKLTGYTKNEVVGRNCRLLYGEDTDKAAVRDVKAKLAEGLPTVSCIINYKKDGTPFWNYMSISPLKDARNMTVMRVEVYHEVSNPVGAIVGGPGTSV